MAPGDNKEGAKFLAFLCAALDREDSPLMVLATLRSDFLGSFQEHPAIRGLRVELFAVPQMETDDFASVIEDPARIAGLELGPGLVQAMISDTKTSDALPLLAFTLRELHESLGQSKLLTFDQYRDIGRLEGCIARAAEFVLKAKPLSESETADLRSALLSMVQVNDNDQHAKQPAQWNLLPASSHDVLERFVSARLLISSEDKNERKLEVAHEALFRAWPRLAEWLKDNKSFLIWQQRLNLKRKEWEVSTRSSDLLLRGYPLTEALDWFEKKPDDVSPAEREFVTASNTRKIKSRIAVVTIAVAMLLIVGGPFVWMWKESVSVKYATFALLAWLHLVSVSEPVMVEIPGGDFLQGDLVTRPNNPLRKVTVKGFMIGKYEVTFEEYDRYVELTDGRPPNDENLGRQRRPVTDVMWEDAVGYAKWLSKATGKRYRLPTDAEWDYAARSGEQDTVWAGTSDENQLKDYAVYGGNSNQVGLVGTKKPNGFGLYDMSGNVWELVEDCFAKAGNECGFHTVRGGCIVNKPKELRVSYQHPNNVGYRGNLTGFRLAQDIP